MIEHIAHKFETFQETYGIKPNTLLLTPNAMLGLGKDLDGAGGAFQDGSVYMGMIIVETTNMVAVGWAL